MRFKIVTLIIIMMMISKTGLIAFEIVKPAEKKGGSFKFVYEDKIYWAVPEAKMKLLLIAKSDYDLLQKKHDNRQERVVLLDDYNDYLKKQVANIWKKDLQIKIFAGGFVVSLGIVIAESIVLGLIYSSAVK